MLEAFGGILGERARKHGAQRGKSRAGDLGERRRRCSPEAADAPAPQQLVHQRREAEDVGAAIPRGAGDALGRGVGPANRRDDADPLERARDAEAGEPRVVGRQQHVARMQRAVDDVDAAAKSSAPASCAATRSASAGGAGPYSRTARSSESAAT